LTVRTAFPQPAPAPPAVGCSVVALGLTLRRASEADRAFLQVLFASFRAEEMALIPWPQPQKDAFLAEQFRLQHHHFVSYFSDADFWIVERSRRSGPNSPVGRFYLDRSTPLWRVIDIGLLPEARGQGFGSALLRWAQESAVEAGAAGIDLHVLLVNPRAQRLYRSLGFQDEGEPEGYHQRMAWRSDAQLNTA
jgi:RimJ/RimL family protein N-acetyltransferase